MHKTIPVAAVLFAMTAPVAQAGVLYKCSDSKGAVTIQSDPCPAGTKQIWKRDSTPAAQPTSQQVVGNAIQQQKNAADAHPAPAANVATPQSAPGAPAAMGPPAAATSAVAPPPPPAAPPPIALPPALAPPAAATPAVAPPPPPAAPPPIAPPPASETPTIRLSPPPPPAQPRANPACDSAKRFAAEARDKIWLGLTADQMQRLYGWVMDQCTSSSGDDADSSP